MNLVVQTFNSTTLLFNLARPERKPDVVIFIDASADAENVNITPAKQAWPDGTTLRSVEAYARENKVAFPKLPEQGNLALNTCTIFNEVFKEGRKEPVVIYLPLTKNNTEFNDAARMARVTAANTIDNIAPQEFKTIGLEKYTTSYTAVTAQDAVNLIALMHYNVIYNTDRIREAICTRAQENLDLP